MIAKEQKKKGKKKFATGDGLVNGKKNQDNEEILSDASDVEGDPDAGYLSSENEDAEEKETVEEKRLRLAKVYLEEIERQEKERLADNEDADDDRLNLQDSVNKRLKEDDLQESGRLRLQIADNYDVPNLVNPSQSKLFRDHKVHKSSVTCHAMNREGDVVLSGSKDGGLVWWRLQLEDGSMTRLARIAGGRKGHEEKYAGHCSAVNAVAASTDGKFYASGDDSNLIHIWSLNATPNVPLDQAAKKIHTFRGHRSPISGLAFRRGTHNLYSCSQDRSVKSWNLDEMSYVETL